MIYFKCEWLGNIPPPVTVAINMCLQTKAIRLPLKSNQLQDGLKVTFLCFVWVNQFLK